MGRLLFHARDRIETGLMWADRRSACDNWVFTLDKRQKVLRMSNLGTGEPFVVWPPARANSALFVSSEAWVNSYKFLCCPNASALV